MSAIGWWGVPLAVAAGAVRAGTPFLFVSLGELLTEKSGRINLGLEGTLVMGAMSGYGTAYLTGSPWLGVLVAGIAGIAVRRASRRAVQPAAGQRHRRRHRADAVRHRPRLLSRQAADPAAGADAAGDRARRVEQYRRGARRAAHQRAVPGRRRARAGHPVGAALDPLGHDPAHGRRIRPMRRARWAIRSIWCGWRRPSPAGSWRASAARSCRSIIRAAGARACRAARASPPLRW